MTQHRMIKYSVKVDQRTGRYSAKTQQRLNRDSVKNRIQDLEIREAIFPSMSKRIFSPRPVYIKIGFEDKRYLSLLLICLLYSENPNFELCSVSIWQPLITSEILVGGVLMRFSTLYFLLSQDCYHHFDDIYGKDFLIASQI